MLCRWHTLVFTSALVLGACGGSATEARAPTTQPPRFAHLATKDLATRDGLACRAYVVSDREPVTDVFLWMNGTGTGTSAFVPEALAGLLRERPAALVTFDKPGVTADFGDRASVRIEDSAFARHTQGTLLECATQALALVPPSARVHIVGHSEGALLALDLLDQRLREHSEDTRVATLILSGVPLEPFDTLVHRQLADKPPLARAVEACDWPMMRAHLGVSCMYLRDAGARPSGMEMFRRIAALAPKTRFRVFAGADDVNTPARFVRELDAWNKAEGHLDLVLREYDGAHGGTPATRRELTELLASLVSTPVSP